MNKDKKEDWLRKVKITVIYKLQYVQVAKNVSWNK